MPPPAKEQAAFVAPKPESTQLMLSQPGITRDGSVLSRRTYIDGQWNRFYQKRPLKMRGYEELSSNMQGTARALNTFNNEGLTYIHAGTGAGFYRMTIDASGAATPMAPRTPVGYTQDATNNWQIDTIFNEAGSTTSIFAHPSPNMTDISSETETLIYYGDVLSGAPIVTTANMSSGGICAVSPYLFRYGHGGLVDWSVPGFPLDFAGVGSGSARPTASKVVRGLPLRGQSAPAAIFWSLDSIILAKFVGTPTFFEFTTVTTSASILSSNGVIEDNGIYYWATTDGFSMFNGVMRDIPNEYNRQWFLDNLNTAQRQKVFAMKVPRWNEIWWCFPYGDATECTHAVILNKADPSAMFWYDTILPNGGRSAGHYNVQRSYPVMTGVGGGSGSLTGRTSVWQHEIGFDEVSGSPATSKAIKAKFRTHEMNSVAPTSLDTVGVSRSVSYSVMEPDFEQVGALTWTAISRANARATEVEMDSVTVPGVVTDANDQTVKTKFTGRLTSFEIESNVAGGNYFAGSPVVRFRPGDSRSEG